MAGHNRAYLYVFVAWTVIGALNYGFHISALNSLQVVISCAYLDPGSSLARPLNLPECIAMTDAQFGVLTASYTVGGFLGSFSAGGVADKRGRKAAVMLAAWCVIVGTTLMAASLNYAMLVLGRTIVGLGSGAATVIVPLFLGEVAPASIKGSIGMLNQLAISGGIFVAVALGLPLSRPSLWRFVPIVSLSLAVIQILLAPLMPESPVWQANQASGKETSSSGVESSPGSENDADLPRDSLGDEEQTSTEPLLAKNQHRPPMSISQLFKSDEPGLRRGLFVIIVAMIAQQLSGINAVFYFSTRILRAVLPANAEYISLFLAFANFVLGLAPVFLIERVGRRPLLLSSLLGIGVACIILAIAINSSAGILASIFILGHVASFAMGAGPIPFVLIGEVVPSFASGAAGSLGLAVNWSANFLVGLGFLPLQNALSKNETEGQGNVFYVFAGITLTLLLVLARAYPRS